MPRPVRGRQGKRGLRVKKTAVILLLMLCLSALCGCRADFDPAVFVQGELDLVYRNQYTDPFL